MDRSAFSRAWDYVAYAPLAKWLAIFGAAGSGASYAALIVLLALFADLIIGRGTMPTFADLSPAQRQQFITHWNNEAPEARSMALGALPPTAAAKGPLAAPVERDDEPAADLALRWKAYAGLLL